MDSSSDSSGVLETALQTGRCPLDWPAQRRGAPALHEQHEEVQNDDAGEDKARARGRFVFYRKRGYEINVNAIREG